MTLTGGWPQVSVSNHNTETSPSTTILSGMASKSTREQSLPQSDGRRQEKKRRVKGFLDSSIDGVRKQTNILSTTLKKYYLLHDVRFVMYGCQIAHDQFSCFGLS